MQEKDKSRNTNLLAETQYKTAKGLNSRWDLYKSCVPPIDIYQKALDALELESDEDVLEVGCGDGSVLISLRQNMHHQGHLVGLEINSTIVRPTVNYLKDHPEIKKIEFSVGTAEKLPFPNDSLDIILAFFMLYHVPNIQDTLMEWKRVLRPSGRVLVTTASRFNRPTGRKLKEEMARVAGVKPHPKFSNSFDLENARKQLEEVFQVVTSYVYEGEMRIEDPAMYLRSMDSTRDMYDPIPNDIKWERAKNHVAKLITDTINDNGYFADKVKRGFFICKNY